MAELVVTYDLYKVLNLDRAWDCKTIKKNILQQQNLWVKRQSATNDEETLLGIEEFLSLIQEGIKHLIKEAKRKIYDEVLDKAYQEGKIKDEVEEKLQNVLEQARAYYRKGNIKLAAQYAQEAIDGHINDSSAYDILARCYFETNPTRALEVVDQGTKIFSDDLDLIWLGARIATVGTNNYDDAQRRINVLLEKAPDNAIGHSEQVYLHLHKGEDDVAFATIDSYIEKHPNDERFKKNAAHDMAAFARNTCYIHSEEGGNYIADKESYKRNLTLCEKAESIHQDEYTTRMVENARYFGKREWNSWNMESIKTLSLYGLIFLLIPPIGLFFLLVDAALVWFSFRPYWQINKTWVTGQMGTLETIVHKIGSAMATLSYKLFWWIVKAVVALFKFLLWVITGGPFRH